MFRHLRLAVAGISIASLVSLAGVATSLTGGGSAAAGRPVVIQPTPVNAAAERPIVTTTVAPATTSTTRARTTLPPTTPAPATTTTAAPKLVRIAPPAVARPAAVAPIVTAPPGTGTPLGTGGSAGDFATVGYRWNPCSVVTVSSSGPDVSAIVSELGQVTGLHLQPVVSGGQIDVQWGSVPVGGEIGQTTWRAVGRFLTNAAVIISQQAQPYLATVLRHELGHALGLGHASRADEVMYPTVGHSSPTDYQAGDLAGLHAVGASAGC